MALFLQAVGIGNVQSYGIQLIQDQVHPVIVAQAHHGRIEKEHVVKGVGHHHALRVPPSLRVWGRERWNAIARAHADKSRQDPISSMNFIAVHHVWEWLHGFPLLLVPSATVLSILIPWARSFKEPPTKLSTTYWYANCCISLNLMGLTSATARWYHTRESSSSLPAPSPRLLPNPPLSFLLEVHWHPANQEL